MDWILAVLSSVVLLYCGRCWGIHTQRMRHLMSFAFICQSDLTIVVVFAERQWRLVPTENRPGNPWWKEDLVGTLAVTVPGLEGEQE